MGWRGPRFPGDLPTLGYGVLQWIEDYLVVPDGPAAGEPLVFTREQAQFIVNLYAVDPHGGAHAVTGSGSSARLVNARLVRRAVLSRAKGWGKSPLVAALCIVEALGDVVPDGWDAAGDPVGRPWSSLGFKAKTQVVAVSEDQTVNTWDPLLTMMRDGTVTKFYDVEILETFVNVPRGRIEFVTSSGRSREGFRPVFAACDQTESWTPSVGGPRLISAIRRNLVKTGGCSVETPNAFIPGEDSVAEKSWEAWTLQQAGKLKHETGILVDHREAPADTDVADRNSLLAAFKFTYGDSEWIDPERVLADFWDPGTDPQDARRFFLNQVTHASDSWLSQPEWAGCADPTKVVADGDMITLGFDGSRARVRGVTDATGLVGCRVGDGHVFEIGVWEQPPGVTEWQVPATEVDAAVRSTFNRWNVVGFFGDPALWESWVSKWEADYHQRLKVKAARDHPIEWYMTGGRGLETVRALEQFHTAVVDGEMTHDGSFALTRHVLNARKRSSRSGIQIAKAFPESPAKIDLAVCAVLAWQARLAAIAAGLTQPSNVFIPRRIR